MTEIQIPLAPSPGWLVGKRFDFGFIVGVAALALASGIVVLMQPALFPIILMLDLWFLGYHHVVSTFTRLCFDKESARQHRFLIFQLPVIVLVFCIAAGWGIGFWILSTTYLYWQWFHYTRQSWGVSQVYRRKAEGTEMEPERFLQLVFYLLPATGILYRSYREPETFLGLELWVFPVPGIVVTVFAAATIVSLGAWFASRVRMYLRGTLPVAHTAYMLSHFVIFSVGYIFIADITIGWLVINVWHNAQYVVFVWIFNNKKFSNGVDAKAKFLSLISQTRNWPYYFAICLSISTAAYLLLSLSNDLLVTIALPAIIIYQTINFHHYIVDSIIWKARKKPMRETLGLKT
jgi:hypothetical protein